MTRYTFSTQKLIDILPSGKVYVYFDEQQDTETTTSKNEETGEEVENTYPIWSYLRAESSLPLEKGILVNDIIRTVYSQADVEAIMRHKLAGVDTGEFEEFNTFAENAKLVAVTILESYGI